jgi:hypothetical protein
MRLRNMAIWVFSSLSCALRRGRKNWTRKARSREKVAFIVQGSTTAFEKKPPVQCDGARLHFGTPLGDYHERR